MSTDKISPQDKPQNGERHSFFQALLSAALIIILLVSVCATIYVISYPPHDDPYTAFYLLDSHYKADSYLDWMDMGNGSPVVVGVTNHEYKPMTYYLAVTLSDGNKTSKLFYNKLSLADNKTWQSPFNIRPDMNGTNMKLDFLLYAGDNTTTPYRECYLYINVNRPWNFTTDLSQRYDN